jgi:hypothetical protein
MVNLNIPAERAAFEEGEAAARGKVHGQILKVSDAIGYLSAWRIRILGS